MNFYAIGAFTAIAVILLVIGVAIIVCFAMLGNKDSFFLSGWCAYAILALIIANLFSKFVSNPEKYGYQKLDVHAQFESNVDKNVIIGR